MLSLLIWLEMVLLSYSIQLKKKKKKEKKTTQKKRKAEKQTLTFHWQRDKIQWAIWNIKTRGLNNKVFPFLLVAVWAMQNVHSVVCVTVSKAFQASFKHVLQCSCSCYTIFVFLVWLLQITEVRYLGCFISY